MSDNPTPIRKDPRSYLMPKEEKHDTPISFRISARMFRLVEVMLADVKNVMPWKTTTDFYRWAIENALRQLSQELSSGKISGFWKDYEATLGILREQELRRKVTELLLEVRTEVREMENAGGYEEIPRVLRKVHEKIKAMEPSFWTKKLRNDFEMEYRDRLKQGRISLRPSQAESEDGD